MESHEKEMETGSQHVKRGRGRPRKSEERSSHEKNSKLVFCNPESPMELISLYRDLSFTDKEMTIRAGFTKNQLVLVKNILHLDYPQIAHFLFITPRALHLRKNEESLSPAISERISVLLELYCNAIEIIGNPVAAREWLIAPTTLLLGQSPLVMAGTHPGLLKVRELLHRIRIGQF